MNATVGSNQGTSDWGISGQDRKIIAPLTYMSLDIIFFPSNFILTRDSFSVSVLLSVAFSPLLYYRVDIILYHGVLQIIKLRQPSSWVMRRGLHECGLACNMHWPNLTNTF